MHNWCSDQTFWSVTTARPSSGRQVARETAFLRGERQREGEREGGREGGREEGERRRKGEEGEGKKEGNKEFTNSEHWFTYWSKPSSSSHLLRMLIKVQPTSLLCWCLGFKGH